MILFRILFVVAFIVGVVWAGYCAVAIALDEFNRPDWED